MRPLRFGRRLVSRSCLCALALVAARAAGSEVGVQLRAHVSDGVYSLEGSIDLDRTVSRQVAWGVLTDYDHLTSFVTGLKVSRVKSGQPGEAPGDLTVEQEATAKALLFSRDLHVLLRVREQPMSAIEFRDVSGRDFELYQGSWTLTDRPAGLSIVYRLQAKLRSAVPPFIAGPALEADATRLLSELRVEILKRSPRTTSTSLPSVQE